MYVDIKDRILVMIIFHFATMHWCELDCKNCFSYIVEGCKGDLKNKNEVLYCMYVKAREDDHLMNRMEKYILPCPANK